MITKIIITLHLILVIVSILIGEYIAAFVNFAFAVNWSLIYLKDRQVEHLIKLIEIMKKKL